MPADTAPPYRRLARDPQLRARMGKAGRTHVERSYALKDLPDRLRTLLETRIGGAASGGETRFSEFGHRYHQAFFSEDQFDFLPRYDETTIDLYRTLIRPYCTSPMVEALDTRTRLFLASLLVEESEDRLTMHDPVWPAPREVVDTAEQTLVNMLLERGFVSLDDVSRLLPLGGEGAGSGWRPAAEWWGGREVHANKLGPAPGIPLPNGGFRSGRMRV